MTRVSGGAALTALVFATVVTVSCASAARPAGTAGPHPVALDQAGDGAKTGPGGAETMKLEGVRWRVTAIGGKTVPADTEQREAHIVFSDEKGSVAGSTGCNRFSGAASRDGDRLTFKPLAVTRMMCPGDAAATEQAFLAAIQATTHYRFVGQALELSDKGGAVVLAFEAQPAK